MCPNRFEEIIALLSTHLFCDDEQLFKCNWAHVQTVMNILVKANVPFNLTVTEGTQAIAKRAALRVYISPTSHITRDFQLEEGRSSI